MLVCSFLVAFFPILSNTALGLSSVDHNLLDLFQMYRASRGRQLLWLRVPSALPYFLGGLRIGGGLALIGAIVAEIAAGSAGQGSGLAFRIIESGYRLNIPRMFAALALISLTGIAIYLRAQRVLLSAAASLARQRAEPRRMSTGSRSRSRPLGRGRRARARRARRPRTRRGLSAATSSSTTAASPPSRRQGTVDFGDTPRLPLAGRIVLPAFVDAHTHLDKGHIWRRAPNLTGDFPGALTTVAADRSARWSAEDVAARMEFSLKCAYAHGTRAIRTHLDSVGSRRRRSRFPCSPPRASVGRAASTCRPRRCSASTSCSSPATWRPSRRWSRRTARGCSAPSLI